MRPVTKFETLDGKIFDTEAEALAHERQLVIRAKFETEAWYREMDPEDIVDWFLANYELKEKRT